MDICGIIESPYFSFNSQKIFISHKVYQSLVYWRILLWQSGNTFFQNSVLLLVFQNEINKLQYLIHLVEPDLVDGNYFVLHFGYGLDF